METHNPAETRRLSPGVRIALIIAGLGMLFGVVAAVELATGSRTAGEGAELLVAPRPMIPASIEGFEVRNDPRTAGFLAGLYRRTQVPVTDVEAAEVGNDGGKAQLWAARVSSSVTPSGKAFRAEVLAGAAAGHGVDAAQFSYRVRDGVAVYTLVTAEGRLWVWFFRDAFVQLFVPASIGDRADAMFQAVLAPMVGAAGKPAS